MMILTLVAASLEQQTGASVQHPEVPCWTAVRTWTAPGERPSDFVIFRTESEAVAVTIVHNRDHFRDRGAVVQNYNFLDYRFSSRPALRVRVYLDNPSTVFVDSPGSRIRGLADLRAAAGDEIVCYLQKRFESIEVLSDDHGYRPAWRARRR